jgi:hypothetical protein
MTGQNWKAELGDQIPEDRGREIETFAGQVELRSRIRLTKKYSRKRACGGVFMGSAMITASVMMARRPKR